MISVVIPVYNVSKYLRRCIDSVCAQTYTDWEIVCVNDGSRDNSLAILEEYAARDARIRIINKENAGVSAARNDGVAAARGEYVLFVDGDDFIHPQTLEITHALAMRANADIVSFRHDIGMYRRIQAGMRVGIRVAPKPRARCYDAARVKFKITDNLLKYATERNHSMGLWRIRHCYPVMHLYRRELIADIKFDTDIRITEDFPFWTRVLFAHPRAVITRLPLYYYVPHWTSALNSAHAQRLFENVGMAIVRSYRVVQQTAKPSEMRRWQREFLWPFIFTCTRAIRRAGDAVDVGGAVKRLREMDGMGCFDNPANMRARKYRRWIRRFISK
ncbi:MAG: glycosyltransferase [Alphaproteobacteria bacterium]|nr:glycosyltransferase [Alphaproteobacteria bacterium]